MTGLTSVHLCDFANHYIPLLTQYCHKLTNLTATVRDCAVSDILLLCRANPLLQKGALTDTILIELMHACPHLHTLWLQHQTDITDISILALSENCSQLQCLDIRSGYKVTEAAVLQLLQRCRKLTRIEVSSSSLSEETWTQLDSNIQKRVSRYYYIN